MPTPPEPHPTVVTTPTDREIVTTRVFDAPREHIFDAWTSPRHLPHWMLGPEGWTMPVCEVDLRPGGLWRAVWRKGQGQEMEIRNVFKEITPPARLVSTESWGGEWPDTLNTLSLSEENGRTTATITILYASKEARDAVVKTGMTDGMAMSFDRLDRYLATMR